MKRQLHFGCGKHHLPDPWENFDRDVDLAKPLRFLDGEASFIFAEHVIEHLDFLDGFRFLEEAKRVLCPGGVLRLAFPDVSRIEMLGAQQVIWYRAALGEVGGSAGSVAEMYRTTLTGWGHRSCWTHGMVRPALLAAGFDWVQMAGYGKSRVRELKGIEGHHLVAGKAARLETTVAEATK